MVSIMTRTIAVAELTERVVDEVADLHVPYVLTRGQEPRAALVPYEDFLRFWELVRSEVHERFDRVQAEMREVSAGFSEEEVAADVATALAELRG